ncbi:MAG: hypothetical protein M3437_07920 [Chloroflexota bacterium]|nr:hypothetical protein [Chloroflexota bacterium]MDQ5864446.1 hypothetical protein [Chloroflexota bacterium]
MNDADIRAAVTQDYHIVRVMYLSALVLYWRYYIQPELTIPSLMWRLRRKSGTRLSNILSRSRGQAMRAL